MRKLEKVRMIGKRLAQSARLMIGVHDYDDYVRHCHHKHPDMPVMSREMFFRACQEARYSGKGGMGRCPC